MAVRHSYSSTMCSAVCSARPFVDALNTCLPVWGAFRTMLLTCSSVRFASWKLLCVHVCWAIFMQASSALTWQSRYMLLCLAACTCDDRKEPILTRAARDCWGFWKTSAAHGTVQFQGMGAQMRCGSMAQNVST